MDLRADRAILVSDWPACELAGENDTDASDLAVGNIVKIVRGAKVWRFESVRSRPGPASTEWLISTVKSSLYIHSANFPRLLRISPRYSKKFPTHSEKNSRRSKLGALYELTLLSTEWLIIHANSSLNLRSENFPSHSRFFPCLPKIFPAGRGQVQFFELAQVRQNG